MDMSKYKGMFVAEAREHLGNMNHLVLALEKDPHDKQNIDSLFRSAHSIKGMAASMGYDEITRLGHKLEDLMDKFRKEEISITPEAGDILLEGIDALERLVGDVEHDRPAEVDTAKIIERINDYLGRSGAAPSSEARPVQTQPAAAPQLKPSRFKVTVEISMDSPAPAARAFLIYRKTAELGEILSITPSETDIKAGKFSGQLIANLATTQEIEKIEEIIKSAGEVASIVIEPLSAEQAPHAVAMPNESMGQKPEPLSQATAKEKEQELPKTVKVSTSVLDYFVNSIGEIIINKSRLHEISKGLQSKELKDGLNQLDRLVRDLQDRVMSVRMMPVESVLERFPRTVRDLARRQEKEIELEIIGREIEIDRSILEGLGNPLTHLVRNSIDHGIESPDERRSRNKPVPAKIRITASREKDQVLIEVFDDGKGIDAERIKESALKKGLITGEQASQMNEKEALLLIFKPGFSTAKEVSDISGRGVGMDAVRSSVETLGGSIEVISEPGEWTRVLLKLPLSVAIINSLMIEAAAETYAIPINRVVKTLEVENEAVKFSQKQRFIDFQGSLIPLLSLRKMLRLDPPPTQDGFLFVVVTEIKGKLVGLIVDRFLGQQETFIKPLGRPLNKIAGLSGTTVLGNGKTVFMLDAGNLVE